MLEKIVPAGVMTPFNNAYSHAVVIPPNSRIMHLSGQIGADADGNVPEDGNTQAENVWRNVLTIIRAGGMDVGDIVKLTAFIVDASVYPAYAAARNRDLGDLEPPASTAIIVPQLILPEWKIEVGAIAAKAD